jgi:RimJ/RimL family protein N-acetyltransferase
MQMSFRFLQTLPLIDRELELIAPQEQWVDALLASCTHPQCALDPAAAQVTRTRVTDFLRAAPHGHQQADAASGRSPCYYFWMRLSPITAERAGGAERLPRWGEALPPIQIAGGISLRIGNTTELELYAGHFGYNVYLPARGNHYAERSCRLLLGLARAHGMKRLWITCNPDNAPSRRTCERLGCQIAGIVPLPQTHPLYQRGERLKCRYWLDL